MEAGRRRQNQPMTASSTVSGVSAAGVAIALSMYARRARGWSVASGGPRPSPRQRHRPWPSPARSASFAACSFAYSSASVSAFARAPLACPSLHAGRLANAAANRIIVRTVRKSPKQLASLDPRRALLASA